MIVFLLCEVDPEAQFWRQKSAPRREFCNQISLKKLSRFPINSQCFRGAADAKKWFHSATPRLPLKSAF
jgi:hypothetical protein